MAFVKAEGEREIIRDNLTFLEQQHTSNTTTPLLETEVDTYLEQAVKTKQDVLENHRKIRLSAAATTDMKPYIADFHGLLAQATRLHAGFHGMKMKFPVSSTATSTSSSSSSTSSSSTGTTAHQSIKLPPLELPKFSGNLQEWIPFRDLFINTVHTSSLTKVEKLTQLKSLLTGEASRQIRSLILSDANYDLAWTALQERYENNRELLFSIMRRLFSQSTVTANSATSLRTLIDTTKECIRSLEVLSIPTQHWDAVILYHLFNKVDSTTRELWEQSLPDTSIPTLKLMYDFLEQRARALSAGSQNQRPPQRVPEVRVRSHHASSPTCKLGCHPGHYLFRCPLFQRNTVQQRLDVIKNHYLCKNCFMDDHSSTTCRHKQNCKICNKRHHSMVHLEDPNNGNHQSKGPTQAPPQQTNSKVTSHHAFQDNTLPTGVLATARVSITGRSGVTENYRSLVDGGSTNCHITERAARRLNLPLQPCHVPMTGLSSASVGVARYITSFVFKPHFTDLASFTATALVVKSISQNLPAENLSRNDWTHLKDLQLADPDFHSPGRIDILFGTDVFWGILENEKRSGSSGQPFAIKSSLGWLVGGPNIASTPVTVFNTNAVLDACLRRFWEFEDIPEGSSMSTEEDACEKHFHSTYSRGADGRFTISIPWKSPRPPIGSSRQMALKRFLALERKSSSNGMKDINKLKVAQHHWAEYKKFMEEYEHLGHMSLVPPEQVANPKGPTFYIPHHYVLKESSTTTKLRVVFDGSAPSSSGFSINDCMMVGPQLQDHLLNIMLRFRTHPVAFTADLEKMYRQIRVNDQDADLQRILWRQDPSTPIREYRLNTVTYGTASAPYLAVKCLQQLAREEQQRFPEASLLVQRDFFVDDLQSGTKTVSEAQFIVQQLISLCSSGGLQLRKWTSNNASLLATIPLELRETKSVVPVELDNNSFSVKTLGVFWNTSEDYYYFKLNLPPDMPGQYTKRTILSDISKIYDPCGWLAPTIITCKLFMQELWSLKCDWDEKLPASTQDKWINLKTSLKELEPIRIPRCVIPHPPTHLFLCGYSDASLRAYSASVYVCCQYKGHPPSAYLLTSKTRVAPVKPTTLPRLELNGALLLSELLQNVISCLGVNFNEIRAYTDSTIVYHWVRSLSTKWKTYVRHRVQKIQDRVPSAKWYHIPGEYNPADCASRGITPEELRTHHLWWSGGDFFWSQLSSTHHDTNITEEETKMMEKEQQPSQSFFAAPKSLPDFFYKFSKFNMLQRVVAFMLRFIQNCQARKVNTPLQHAPLSVTEIVNAHHLIIKKLQQYSFPAEYQALQRNNPTPSSSNLLNLMPFLGHDGIIRVGGRVNKANIPYDRKHQILLPRSHHITSTIIMDIHLRNLHAGPSSTLASLHQRYWVVNGRDTVRYVLKKCVICKRQQASMMQQVMGDLPYHRVNASRPFSKVGIDYAGPFSIRPLVRSKITLKCWLALFVCFATRALHIEVVSSLTTECFLAALRRFISRRGRPSDIFSDCGTNFKGADRVIREFFLLATDKAVVDECASQQIQWHFNPAGAPHFGGLWEAGVRSVKYHLKRVMGTSLLTYEEMLTLVCQVEGILNSRPLIPASTDPSDLQALTPAHFIVGTAITAIPEPSLVDEKENHLDRWQLLQQRQQLFWRRWSSEFISRLQQRPKWCKISPELQPGAMVIVKDERLPPLKWKLGRVVAVHPGADHHVRVATVKTADGEFKRPIVKLCLLPITQPE